MKEVPIDSFEFIVEEEARGDVEVIDGFIDFNEEELKGFKSQYGIAMDLDDLKFCQEYFKMMKEKPNHYRIKANRHLLVRPL